MHRAKRQSGMFDVDTLCVVIEDEEKKKQCRTCGCWRVLELYRGENATCNICLGHR